MILVILAVSIVLVIAGIILYEKTDSEDLSEAMQVIGFITIVISIVVIIILGIFVSKLNVIDDQIAMYEEENTRIEEQIATIVKQYQEYETEIFSNAKSDSAITLVSLYPELKSDSLVSSQIEVYVKNNERIKELKEKKITGNVLRWWLYFG